MLSAYHVYFIVHSVETDSVKNSEIPPSYEEQGDTKEEYRFTDDGIQLYEGHRPITGLQRSLLTIGAAVTSLYDPTRGGNHKFFYSKNVLREHKAE